MHPWMMRLNIKMSVPPTAIYTLNDPAKVLMRFFTEIEKKTILTFTKNLKGSQIANPEEKQSRRPHSPFAQQW